MKFPYTGWVLTPGFKPKQENFVKAYGSYKAYNDWHITDKGKNVHINGIYPDLHSAIEGGHERLRKQQEELEKNQANINKRRAELGKAQKSL